MKIIYLILVIAIVPEVQAEVWFEGKPMIRQVTNPSGAERQELSAEESEEYKLVIEKKGDKYFWASRENKELFVVNTQGAFIDFLAPGSGHIRVVKPEFTSMVSGANGPIYFEHLTQMLGSFIYYGK